MPWTVNELQKSRFSLCPLERGGNKVSPFRDKHCTQCLKVYLTLLASLACTSVCFYTVMHGCLWWVISHWRMLSGHFMSRCLKEEPCKSRYWNCSLKILNKSKTWHLSDSLWFILPQQTLLVMFSHSVMSDFFDPKECSMQGFPVLHSLLSQTHVHWVGDAIQPSHPLSSPSPAFNLSQQQGLFQWASSSHQVAKIL